MEGVTHKIQELVVIWNKPQGRDGPLEESIKFLFLPKIEPQFLYIYHKDVFVRSKKNNHTRVT